MSGPGENEVRPSNEQQSAEEEDYYMDGPYLVFTAAYHRKRGFCCGSGCRHCPYREDEHNETITHP